MIVPLKRLSSTVKLSKGFADNFYFFYQKQWKRSRHNKNRDSANKISIAVDFLIFIAKRLSPKLDLLQTQVIAAGESKKSITNKYTLFNFIKHAVSFYSKWIVFVSRDLNHLSTNKLSLKGTTSHWETLLISWTKWWERWHPKKWKNMMKKWQSNYPPNTECNHPSFKTYADSEVDSRLSSK